MTTTTRPPRPPSLVVRGGGTTLRLAPTEILWTRADTVARIPYAAVGDVDAEFGASSRMRLRIWAPEGASDGVPLTYEVRCARRSGAAFTDALVRQLSGVSRPKGRVPSGRAHAVPPVTLEPRSAHLPVVHPYSREQLGLRALTAVFVLNSLALVLLGQFLLAVMTWIGFLGWWGFADVLSLLVSTVKTSGAAVTRGVRMEARHVGRGPHSGPDGGADDHTYEYTDTEGRVRTYVHVPFGKGPPRPRLTVVVVPGSSDPAKTPGELVAFSVTVLPMALGALFAGAVGGIAFPGALLAVVLMGL
ncbi:hypothetical protein WDH52_19510 [Streptomyces sp. TRM70308]|uniref:hypothetical protein n=1 Tax=Streptomyces sp. TRM70308 TaxID=3131932 RepID=UPI003CFE3609